MELAYQKQVKPAGVLRFPERPSAAKSRTRIVQPGEHPVDAAQRLREHEKSVQTSMAILKNISFQVRHRKPALMAFCGAVMEIFFKIAIETIGEINRMVSYFLERGKFRDACLFVVGCNTALRTSDVLCLRWKDFLREDGSMRECTDIVEGKTQKRRRIWFGEAVREAVLLYLTHLSRPFYPDGYVFVSESGNVGHVPLSERKLPPERRSRELSPQPLSKCTAANIIRKAAQELGLYTAERRVSSYTMRKTALNAMGGFVDGVPLPDGMGDKMAGVLLAQITGNHTSARTTSQYYLELQTRAALEAVLRLNLGLDAIRAYQEVSR